MFVSKRNRFIQCNHHHHHRKKNQKHKNHFLVSVQTRGTLNQADVV